MSSIFIRTGNSCTIVTRFWDIVEEAEKLYGERDKSFTILGIEGIMGDQPKSIIDSEQKTILIQLTTGGVMDMNRAILQASHVAIHCLSPSSSSERSMLEEGLATHFSLKYSKEKTKVDWILYDACEIEASKLVEEALKHDSRLVKKFRAEFGKLSNISERELLAVSPKLPKPIAEKLAMQYAWEKTLRV